MIPKRARTIIEAAFDLYPGMAVKSDDRLPTGAFWVIVDDGRAYIKACTQWANWAIDIRDNSLVPELYADDAPTILDDWA
jgi:hypothetical protein